MNFKAFGLTIVIFLVISAFVSYLTPSGSTEKTIKFILSLAFICVIISSLSKIEMNFDSIKISSQYQAAENATDIFNESLDYSEKVLAKKIENELKKNGIKIKDIMINMDISDDDSIIINNITYFYEEKSDTSKVNEIIYKITGCDKIEGTANEEN